MRSKLSRFQENAERDNVIEPGKPVFETIKGHWHKHFGNTHPLVLELGCGKGAYTVGLACLFPERNFVGVDVKGARLWAGSKTAAEERLHNAAFLRIRILDIGQYVAPHEADEIWITFPDPRPRDRDEKRRLTSPRFLDIYKSLLKPESRVHLKTDNTPLFAYTLEVLQNREDIACLEYTYDFHASDLPEKQYGIITGYEKRFVEQGMKINYLKFCFSAD